MTENTGDVRFGRSAFGGFNRKDVMEYIDKLQRSMTAQRGDPDAFVQFERERDELARENERLREENTALRAQLRVAQATTHEPHDEKLQGAVSEEAFSATAEPVSDGDAKTLSMRDVDEMVQKYFG